MTKIIFGMGIALQNSWKIINEYYHPLLITDNDEKKWGKNDIVTGLKCINPASIIECEDPEVLVTIGDPYSAESVKQQLEGQGISCKMFREEIEKWCKYIELPDNLEALKQHGRKVILFNTPNHDNIGDHLITLMTQKILRENFSEDIIVEISDFEYLCNRKKIKKYISKEDILLISGGGFLGSLWLYNGEENVRDIIREYPDNRMVILPQTIYFEDSERGRKEQSISVGVYEAHKNLIVCARERQSFDILRTMIDSQRVKLFPDMALFWNENYQKKRTGMVGICFRKDKEKVLDSNDALIIESIVKKYGYCIKYVTMHTGTMCDAEHREEIVNLKLKELTEYDIVVTDTLHCMVSSALVGTTCISFDNLSGKVKNVFEWIRNLDYVNYCDSVYQFENIFMKIKNTSNHYFLSNREHYIEELVSIIK